MPSMDAAMLKGQVALVTGGTRGLGRDIARGLVNAGATVVVCGRNEPADADPALTFHAADVRDAAQATQLVDRIIADHGRIDIVVNNAGGSPPAAAEDCSSRFAEAIVGLNLMAPFYVAKAAFPHMAARKSGSIINISSVAGTRPSPRTALYGAAKAGLLSLTQSLAQEWGPHGIRVNALIAGLMLTDGNSDHYGDAAGQAAVAASLPLGRMGRGDDLAGAVLWLCSPAAAWVSGARIEVDGGGERPLFLDLATEQ